MAGSKRLILVVDDNEYNREILVENLTDLGFECEEAPDGYETLVRMKRQPLPALVLLDVMMPGIDGFEVCRQLRQDPRTQDVPIIMVTAKAMSRDVVQGLHAGANDYVSKPIDMEVLLARVETHLRLRELSEESRRSNERLMRELAAARAVQESLLPQAAQLRELPASYGLGVAALWRPCEMLGGDFWDIVALSDGSLGLLLIDFAGAGVVPSLYTFRIKTFLQGQIVGIHNPGLAMARLNGELMAMLPEHELATCLYARYDPDRRQFTMCNGGCPHPMIYRARTGAVERVAVTGLPVGAFQEASWTEKVVTLDPGDKIVFYTDGLVKGGTTDDGPYNEVRLAELVSQRGNQLPSQLAATLGQDIDALAPHTRHRDDTTVIFAEVVRED
ncbi:MAG: fused response regulator/phosphatase [Candidatus Sumerlaeia bacterium]|nr:fused response regulator/phosphatase [Candidatus Sumerlaeia bacterium]